VLKFCIEITVFDFWMHNIATSIRWNACSISYSLLSP